MYYASVCYSSSTVLVLGDSLSAGYGLQGGASWVDLLADKVSADNIDAIIINSSVSGATSADGLNALPKLLSKYHPTVIILALGSNDGLRGNPVMQLQSNLAQIISKCQAANVKVLLVGFHLPPNYGAAYTNSFAAVFPKLSRDYGVPLVPFLLAGFEKNYSYFQQDNLHPTAKAQEFMLHNVWQYLEPMLKSS